MTLSAIITVGIPASGKSTFARDLEENHGWCEINRDDIRFKVVCPGKDWSNYKFSGANEKKVTEVQGRMIMDAWGKGENIIISDTNLNASTRTRLTQQLGDLGYEVEVKAFPISRVEAVKRDNLRANGVGESVIYKLHDQMLDFEGRRRYTPDPTKRNAIIVDVDGTIAEMHDRGPFEWHKVGQDKPRQFIIDLIRSYYHNRDRDTAILIVSGRSDECYDLTEKWVSDYLPYTELHMRKEGDFRKDDAVKEEIFWTHLEPRYNIVGVFDDRPQVVRLWHELRLPNVICVGNPYLEF